MLFAVGARIPLRGSPDILIFMQMAGDIATCTYYTGIDPFTKQPVYVARNRPGRKTAGQRVKPGKPGTSSKLVP